MRRFCQIKPSKTFCLLQLVQLLICFTVTAQGTPGDTAEIDRLNELSDRAIAAEQKDSADYYAGKALESAKRTNYVNGIAVALCRQAQIAKHFEDDFRKTENLAKQSLSWYERTANKKGIEVLYFYLSYAAIAQSRFNEALEYAERTYELAERNGDETQVVNALFWMCNIDRQNGDYEKFFSHTQQVYELAIKAKSKAWTVVALYFMAQLHMQIEDYPNALAYFRQVWKMYDAEIRDYMIANDYDIWLKMEYTEVFSHLRQFDSAWHYFKLFKPADNKKMYLRIWWVSTGECHYLQKNYPRALQHFQWALAEHERLQDRNEVMRTLLNIGKTHLGLNNNAEAGKYGKEGLKIALETKAKQFIRDGYKILSVVYDRLGKKDSANLYFREYINMKETVLNDQTKGKFAAYAYEQKIALINKEKEIQQAKLDKESLLRKVLIAGLGALFLFGFILVRNIRLSQKYEKQDLQHKLLFKESEGQRLKAQFQQQAVELKMQALRAQMNPHFIFNSLNSINRFILENNKNEASLYLSKFSKLIRLILYNSQSPYITLESELEALQLYLELESLRFDNRFDYRLQVGPELDVSAVKVPPLIIQPYVENAIWHGLMQKKDKGHLQVELYEENKMLFCRIVDDGIGRTKSAELRSAATSTYKSLGTKITADRISLLQRKSDNEISVTINDLTLSDGTSGGTMVLLRIPLLNNV
jgi:tetratricopeptide (TPR) repeat protein